MIRVYVRKRRGRRNYSLIAYRRDGAKWVRHRDAAGRHEVTAGTHRKREAYEAAGLWQRELEAEGRRTCWLDFCQRYEREELAQKSAKHQEGCSLAFGWLEQWFDPQSPADVTADVLSRYKARLLDERGCSSATIRTYLSRVRTGLKWAAALGLAGHVPAVSLPKLSKTDTWRGRPITTEEFERIVALAPRVVGGLNAASWDRFLWVLWLSSLRLAESLALSWDARDDLPHILRLDRKRPMMRIPETEKGRRARLLPAMPDFVEYLRRTPAAARAGPVCCPTIRGKPAAKRTVQTYLARIARKANVVVRETAAGKKFATAQSIRQGFATRWAPQLSPRRLQQLMRHERLETTERYYVNIDAEQTADEIWEAWETVTSTSEE
jgi:integrase